MLIDRVWYHFTPGEHIFCASVAAQRAASKQFRRGFRQVSDRSSYALHLEGVLGELAVGMIHRGRVNQAILPDGDGHLPDMVLTDGRSIEIKTSLWAGDDVELKFFEDEIAHAKHVCLVQLYHPDKARVYPVWEMSELLPLMRDKDYGHGVRKVFCPLWLKA